MACMYLLYARCHIITIACTNILKFLLVGKVMGQLLQYKDYRNSGIDVNLKDYVYEETVLHRVVRLKMVDNFKVCFYDEIQSTFRTETFLLKCFIHLFWKQYNLKQALNGFSMNIVSKCGH